MFSTIQCSNGSKHHLVYKYLLILCIVLYLTLVVSDIMLWAAKQGGLQTMSHGRKKVENKFQSEQPPSVGLGALIIAVLVIRISIIYLNVTSIGTKWNLDDRSFQLS